MGLHNGPGDGFGQPARWGSRRQGSGAAAKPAATPVPRPLGGRPDQDALCVAAVYGVPVLSPPAILANLKFCGVEPTAQAAPLTHPCANRGGPGATR